MIRVRHAATTAYVERNVAAAITQATTSCVIRTSSRSGADSRPSGWLQGGRPPAPSSVASTSLGMLESRRSLSYRYGRVFEHVYGNLVRFCPLPPQR